MATKTPDQVSQEYLTTLKALKPTVNTDQQDSDWWIRSKVYGGVVAGAYADQRKSAEDAFPQNARHEALAQHLDLYFASGFLPAQNAVGFAKVTAPASGGFVPQGTPFTYTPNGNIYNSAADVNLGTAVSGLVPLQSVDTGQSQNLFDGASLSLASPPSGIDSAAVVFGGPLANGKDGETDQEAAARVLNRVRSPVAGGTENDYKTWAKAASPSVNLVTVVRYIFGPGTIGLYFTAGTSNVDDAIDNDEAIVRIPSDSLVEQVHDYVDALNPINDCLHVFKPQEVTQDVTVRVTFKSGFTGLSLLPGQTANLKALIEREVARALYKTPIGGRILGASGGFVLASEIEEAIDIKLSGEEFTVGSLGQVVLDRQVSDLTASGSNRQLLGNQIVKPGTVTIVEL